MATVEKTTQNLTLTDADTEYSVTVPDGTNYYTFQCRTSVVIRYAFETGKVATPTEPYMTLKADYTYNSFEDSTSGDEVLYFASGSAGVVVEIEFWT